MAGVTPRLTYRSRDLDLPGLEGVLLRPATGAPAAAPAPELVAAALAGPEPLSRFLEGARRVGVLIPDGTRKAALPVLLPGLLEAVRERAGVEDVEVFMACGAHRPPGPEEVAELTGGTPATPVFARREGGWTELGSTRRGTPVALDAAVAACDALVGLGGVKHHYFAGFGGGPKFLVPGVARIDTLEANHALAFDQAGRRPGAATGVLEENPLHADLREAAAMGPPLYSIHLIQDDAGEVVEVHAGEGLGPLRAAAASWTRRAVPPGQAGDFDRVVASAGESPDDIDLVQVHKAMDAACAYLRPGGELLLAAACPAGVGPAGARELLDLGDPDAVAARLRERFELRGIFAWSFLAKTRDYRVRLLSELPAEDLARWGVEPVADPGEFARAATAPGGAVAWMPVAARTMPRPDTKETPCATS